jgi:hypothetical protein
VILDDIFNGKSNDPYAAQREMEKDDGLDRLFDQRTAILKTKLEVFASELLDRLRIRSKNLLTISENQDRLGRMLETLTCQANYHFRDHKEKSVFYQLSFDLERQKRSEDVECWRDVAQIMKDLLNVWEAMEQAKSRSMFLNP